MYQGRHSRSARNVRIAVIGAALAALLSTLIALAGCAAPASGPVAAPESISTAPVTDLTIFPFTITDDSYREVTFTVPATRVVSLAPANTEVVYALGVFDRVVGVTTWDDYPAEVAGIAKMGDFTTPNLEAIAAAQPDLILVTGGVQADVLGKLESLGAKVLVIDPTNIAGVYDGIERVSKALGIPAKGVEVVAKMKSDLTYIRAAVSAEPTVSAFIEIGWNPLYTAGPKTLLDDVLTQAGGTNVVTLTGYVGYSVEQLVKDQPSVYLGTLSSITDTATVAARPGYSAIAAVQNGRVFSLNDNLVSRPGPRLIEGVREIAKALHPSVFN